MARSTKIWARKDRKKWYGVFEEFPNEKGNSKTLPLASFKDFEPIENKKGKLIPQDHDYDELIGLWAKHRDQLREEVTLRPQDFNFGDLGCIHNLFDEYLETEDFKNLSKGKANSRLNQQKFWRNEIGSIKVLEINPGHVAEKRKILMSKFKASTTVDYLNALSSAFETMRRIWAEKGEQKIPLNPVIYRPTIQDQTDRILSEAELHRLIDAVEKVNQEFEMKGFDVWVLLGIVTGARKEEVSGLKWSEVDLKKGWVTFHRVKNDYKRTVQIEGKALDHLKKWFGQRTRIDVDWVFPGKGLNHADYYRRAWKQARALAGIKDFTFHGLRHSCASFMAMAGVHPKKASAILGHRQLKSYDRYTHLHPEDIGEVAPMFARKLEAKVNHKENQTLPGVENTA